MGRFAFPSKYGMRLNPKEGSTLAFFTIIDTELGIKFNDVQLKVRNDGGHFVSAPYRTYEDSEGNTKYVNFWQAAYDEDEEALMDAGVEYLEEMTEAALKKYKQLAASEGGSAKGGGKGKGKGTSKPAARKSGRGPVVDEDDSDWGF